MSKSRYAVVIKNKANNTVVRSYLSDEVTESDLKKEIKEFCEQNEFDNDNVFEVTTTKRNADGSEVK